MCQGDPDPAEENPDDIEYRRQAARLSRHFPDLPAERKECQKANLETLNAKRYSDNGNTKCQAGNHVLNKDQKSPENEPDDVAD